MAYEPPQNTSRMTIAPPPVNPQPQQPPATGGSWGRSFARKPQFIPFETTEDAVNNTIAAGEQQADPRYQEKKFAGKGFSSGAGSQFMAQQAGSMAKADAAAQAAQIRTADQATNAKLRAEYQHQNDATAIAAQESAAASAQAKWDADFSKRQNALDLLKTLLLSQGQFMPSIMKQYGNQSGAMT